MYVYMCVCMYLYVQLQHLVTDAVCIQLMDLYSSQQQQLSSMTSSQQRTAAELTYQRRAEQLLTDENCFRLVLVCWIVTSTTSLIHCILVIYTLASFVTLTLSWTAVDGRALLQTYTGQLFRRFHSLQPPVTLNMLLRITRETRVIPGIRNSSILSTPKNWNLGLSFKQTFDYKDSWVNPEVSYSEVGKCW